MRIQVYEEQYKTKTPHHDAGKIANDQMATVLKGAGDALWNATLAKLEKDDALDSARIEADTVHEADKMLQQYKANANPDDFVGDMDRQQKGIQSLIKDKSKGFRTAAARTNFITKMTRGVEEPYIKQSLEYSYNLQAKTAMDKFDEGIDAMVAPLLAGNTLITPQAVIANAMNFIDTNASLYNLTKQQIDAKKSSVIKNIVVSYAYGAMDRDPKAIRGMLLGDSFDAWKDSKVADGQDFTMDEFWDNPDLQKEYRESEYGAKWIDVLHHLDYPTRMQLVKLCDETIAKKDVEAKKAELAAKAKTEYDLNNAQEACILQAKANGTLPTEYMGTCTRQSGSTDEKIALGEIHKGPLKAGNSFTEEGITFAKGLAGGLNSQGYDIYLTSDLRPYKAGEKKSQHNTASAKDIQVFKDGKFSVEGSIRAYAEAVKKYSNHMRKGGTIFEIDLAKLPYVKTQLEKRGIDISYINWADSEKEGAKALAENRQHIHFGIDPKADYTKTSSGSSQVYNFQTQLGGQWFDYYKAQGKTDVEAYGAALAKEDDVEAHRYSYTIKQKIITGQGTQNGKATDPSMYTKSIVAYRQSIVNDKKLSDRERIRKLKALDYLETELPKAQKMYNEDPAGFVEEYWNETDPAKNAAIQHGVYGISASEVHTMTDAQAKSEAATIERLSGEQFVQRSAGYSMTDRKLLAKYIADPDKSGLFLYSGQASPRGQIDIKNAITNWENVKQFIEQQKNAKSGKVFGKGENWRAFAQGELLKNKVINDYLADLNKVDKPAGTGFISAMTTLYAYRASLKGGDADPKVIVDDIAREILGDSINTVTVRNPVWGATTVNISQQAFNQKEAQKLTTNMEIINGLGVNPWMIGAFDPVATSSGSDVIDKATKVTLDTTARKNHVANIRSSMLHGTADGLNIVYAYGDTKTSPYSGNIMRDANGKQCKIALNDLLELDRQAETAIANWKKGDGQNSYYIPGYGKYTRVNQNNQIQGVSKTEAKKAAMEYLLTNKYSWLNRSDYTQFKRSNVWVSKYDNGKTQIFDPKARQKEFDLNVAKGTPAKNYKGVYDIYYDINGKEVSRKKVNFDPAKFSGNLANTFYVEPAKSSKTTSYAADLYGFDYNGNIDLFDRPQVRNADGSISTVKSISYSAEIDGKIKHILIPTVSDEGKIMDKETAIKYWKKKKQYLGIYDTEKEATIAAKKIHEQQENFYLGGN